MGERERVRWRCRRGMLELDLIFSRYFDARFDDMTEVQKEAFQSLLEYPDNDIWDWLNARTQCADHEVAPLIADLLVFAKTVQAAR